MIVMPIRPKPALPLLIASIALAPTPALADALQQQIVAAARGVTPEDFAFTQSGVNQRSGEAAKDYVLVYDPRRPRGTRWTLVRAEGRAPTAKETAGFAKQANAGRVPSYGDIAKWFGGPAVRVAASKTSVTYRFASLAAGTVKLASHDASADTAAEAVVNTAGPTPFVETVHLTSGKPFRMMLVARIERIDMTAHYQMMANGRPAIVGTSATMTGSLLGKPGWFKGNAGFSDIRAVR
ncbi:MAG: hypothetical protein RL367_293 [Pseudomonadota bacterium]